MSDERLTLAELCQTVANRGARILTAQALAEGTGLDVANRLRRSSYLTSEERDFAGDVLRNDEVAHLKWALAAARKLADFRYRGYGAWQRNCNEAFYQTLLSQAGGNDFRRDRALLYSLFLVERFFYKHFEIYESVLSILLPQEIGAGIARLKTDECRHINWGQQVSRRLRLDYCPNLDATFNLSLRDTPSHWAAQEIMDVMRDLTHI